VDRPQEKGLREGTNASADGTEHCARCIKAAFEARSTTMTQLRMAVAATAQPHPVVTVIAASAATGVLALAFSWATGQLGQVVEVPVGTLTLAAALLLTAWSPARFGWTWRDTGRQWRVVLVTLLVVIGLVAIYRALGQRAPYEPSAAEFLVVPLGEEALFRGFVVTVLTLWFARSMSPASAAACAVVAGAVGFGVGHLGNLGYVPAGFVVIQAVVATALGLIAGWLRVRTGSLVGPVMLHGAMNVVAVL
jgi:membrane protease YdiL (CAAX protease family)